ncbi:glutamate carboxypeptidase 2-like [Mytilus trossulus]|uniref:glutamate carboxypeptidase 2-like n=1 Tax=Mytilus trossulus TaxID=6551 RepID=UPI003004CCEB
MTSREYKKVIWTALLILLAFIIGVLIGYFSRTIVFQPDSRTKLLDRLNRDGDNSITQKLFDTIDTGQIDSNLRILTGKPRLAGTENNRESGDFVHRQFLQYGLQSEIIEYNVTLSYPDKTADNYVSVIEEDGTETFRTVAIVEGDEVQPFNAFSPSGNVMGDLVFVNYARESDFQKLKNLNINVSGTIVIAKYGKGFRGNKVKNAYEAGAIGIILYSDPGDYAPIGTNATYPDTVFLPNDGAQRGNIVLNKGDQSTPGYPANEYSYRLREHELNARLPKIPCLPISYSNAYSLLSLMTGDQVPDEWKGDLNITYRIGPGLTNKRKINLRVSNKLAHRRIFNVIGKIKGELEPDRYVMVGNHRDAWVYGSIDPISGTVVMMETARAFGQLLKDGWRPRRSVLFCSWDAEEFGLVGSFEWVEDNSKWLTSQAVAYINVDSAVSGNDTIHLKTVPLLQKVFEDAANKVPDPYGKYNSAYEAWNNHPRFRVYKMGGGSDHVPFLAGLGVPSMYPKYSYLKDIWGSTSTPLYHSRYENYHAFKMIDPELKFAKTMTSIISESIRNLADSRIIPFDLDRYAEYISNGVEELLNHYGQVVGPKMEEWIHRSVNAFHESAARLKSIIGAIHNDNDDPLYARQVNDKLLWLERSFLIDEGLPGNSLYKHLLHSPDTANYYGGVSFPGLGGITQCMDIQNTTECHVEIHKHVAKIIQRIFDAAKTLDR